jgi:hypothetical protein
MRSVNETRSEEGVTRRVFLAQRRETPPGQTAETNTTADYERVKLLFDYTKFHIGLYLTLGGILVTAVGLKDNPIQFWAPSLWMAIISMTVAGFAGGMVASTLAECENLQTFMQQKTGPWECKLLTGRWWTRIEHTAFWIAIVCGLASVGACRFSIISKQWCG